MGGVISAQACLYITVRRSVSRQGHTSPRQPGTGHHKGVKGKKGHPTATATATATTTTTTAA